MPTREELFESRLPKFTDQQAETFFLQRGGEIVGVWGRRGAPDYVVLAFANQTETFGPIALNPVAAKALQSLLNTLLH